MSDSNLVTTFTFKGREYLVKMNIINNIVLDIIITDKYTGEDWQCNYDATYLETLTHRTGNFKQFNIFVTMLKSGLLKTSDCVSLDLLTFEDLEILRSRRATHLTSRKLHENYRGAHNNRRYLILTYSVEFDRIHYPLPLDYCGAPDPQLLQANIRRLESEINRLQEQLEYNTNSGGNLRLQERVESLTQQNFDLNEEIQRSKHKRLDHNQVKYLDNAISNLEESVIKERNSHAKLVKQLKEENENLTLVVKSLQEKLKTYTDRIGKKTTRHSLPHLSDPEVNLLFFKPAGKEGGDYFRNASAGDADFHGRQKMVEPRSSRMKNWNPTLNNQALMVSPTRRRRSTSGSLEKQVFVMESRGCDYGATGAIRKKARESRSRSGSNGSRRSRGSQKSKTSSTKSSKPTVKQFESNATYQTQIRVSSIRPSTRSRKNREYSRIQNRIQELERKLKYNLAIN